jgi:hypothetical protein
MSNYYSLVKAALIEKGLEFEEVKAPPTQKDANQAVPLWYCSLG